MASNLKISYLRTDSKDPGLILLDKLNVSIVSKDRKLRFFGLKRINYS